MNLANGAIAVTHVLVCILHFYSPVYCHQSGFQINFFCMSKFLSLLLVKLEIFLRVMIFSQLNLITTCSLLQLKFLTISDHRTFPNSECGENREHRVIPEDNTDFQYVRGGENTLISKVRV